MSTFLQELGKKAAERWLALLVLPGLLFLGFVAATWIIRRHGAWFDVEPVITELDVFAKSRHGTGWVVLAAAGILLTAVAVATVVQLLGRLVERLWFAGGKGYVGRWLVNGRRTRWQNADADYEATLFRRYRGDDPAGDLDTLLVARNRICLVEPRRPTWMSDRIRAISERVQQAYDLDFVSAWPRLWLSVPDTVRAELAGARARVTDAARLSAWGLAYLVPAIWWWPSPVITVAVLALGWWRGRQAVDALSVLAESSVDLYGRDVAEKLGLAVPGVLTAEVGLTMTQMLRKGS